MRSTKISSNIEDYLKTIYRIELERGVVRVKEISEVMQVTYPSTSGILGKMEAMGLVEHEKYGYVRLSDSGRKIARKMFDREIGITLFLHNILKVKKEQARLEACRLEHGLTDETAKKLLTFIEFIATPSKVRDDFMAAFEKQLKEVELEASEA